MLTNTDCSQFIGGVALPCVGVAYFDHTILDVPLLIFLISTVKFANYQKNAKNMG